MKYCRICGELLKDPIYTSSGISITSVRSVSSTPLTVYMCSNCLHIQKPAINSTMKYYDKDYRISLESDEFDQLYDKVDNKPIYRTDYQAELVLNFVNIPLRAKILDFGAGKASTLMKIFAIRSDITPYVFDVSENYKKYWQVLPLIQQAVYNIPETWTKKFSLIMAHFVFEHVENPCLLFNNIAKLLTEDGLLFFTIPNLLTNIGDILAVDHINHYSVKSINIALKSANLSIIKIDKNIFRGAIVCVATKNFENSIFTDYNNDVIDYSEKINDIMLFWFKFDKYLKKVMEEYGNLPTAIFGAGIYGSYIASKIKNSVLLKCFLDNSEHLINTKHMGFPVVAPNDICEDIRIVYSGLNPITARSVLEQFKINRNINIIYFDEGGFKK